MTFCAIKLLEKNNMGRERSNLITIKTRNRLYKYFVYEMKEELNV